VRAGEAVTRAALPEIRKWLQPEPLRQANPLKTPAVNPATMPAD